MFITCVCRDKKGIENRALQNEEKMGLLESHLREAKLSVEDADRKYDEVTNSIMDTDGTPQGYDCVLTDLIAA